MNKFVMLLMLLLLCCVDVVCVTEKNYQPASGHKQTSSWYRIIINKGESEALGLDQLARRGIKPFPTAATPAAGGGAKGLFGREPVHVEHPCVDATQRAPLLIPRGDKPHLHF